MKIISLDGNKLVNKVEAHEHLKEMLELPEYYGKNLDALYDCLTETEEVEVWIENVSSESACLRGILDVFMDAAEENKNLKVKII